MHKSFILVHSHTGATSSYLTTLVKFPLYHNSLQQQNNTIKTPRTPLSNHIREENYTSNTLLLRWF